MSNELLRVENLSKSYPSEEKGGKLVILEDINLLLKQGETIAITGKSGCGKSTLLSLLALLSPKDGGKIYYEGMDTDQIKDRDRARLRNEKMGFVFQNSMLLEDFSALENVAMPLMIKGEKKKIALEKAQEYLKMVGIEERKNHRPIKLSGGERQRTAIARALITEPSVVFADEPTGSLDEKTSRIIEELLIESVKKTNRGLILVTHNPVFASKAHKVFVLSNGVLNEK
ncbi:MAG: ABC transporter ATP-binding protein [Spirochaetales bacterium]|nr:ABC transporter ATP-binding protein [Spirochaetales bacterium]